jgi:hypothetical protein
MKKYKNGFVYVESPSFGKRLELFYNPHIYLYNKLEECRSFFLEEKMNGLIFANTIYYPFDNLEILKEFKGITSLEIATSNITNFEGLKYASKLKNVIIDTSAKLNLGILPNTVANLILKYHKKITGLNEMKNLRLLSLNNDNNDLELPKYLERLILIKSRRDSLKFTEDLKSLQKLELYFCNKITSVDEVPKWIKEINVEDCKYLNQF